MSLVPPFPSVVCPTASLCLQRPVRVSQGVERRFPGRLHLLSRRVAWPLFISAPSCGLPWEVDKRAVEVLPQDEKFAAEHARRRENDGNGKPG